MIDVVGHFGSLLSYATVASEVARALRDVGLLGSVENLDTDWHPQIASFRTFGSGSTQKNSHVLVFAAPNHYIEGYAAIYGRDRSALYVSPNTDRLAKEHAETCLKFGRLIVPSVWCEHVVLNSTTMCTIKNQPDTTILPLGVSPLFAENVDRSRFARISGRQMRAIHLSTDRAWPGRKGTEELLDAWKLIVDRHPEVGWELWLSMPPPLVLPATLTVADLSLSDHVRVVGAPDRGATDAELVALYAEADLIIAPSRCEGFGMMILAALVNHCPLVTTYNTGHTDFLADTGGWIGVPTPHTSPLFGEEGDAPIVEPEVLAYTIEVAFLSDVRHRMIDDARRQPGDGWGTWPWATRQWVERLREWTEET